MKMAALFCYVVVNLESLHWFHKTTASIIPLSSVCKGNVQVLTIILIY